MNKDDFEIEVTVRGPSVERETNYGLRSDRETMGTLRVPVTGAKAWEIYSEALVLATEPEMVAVEVGAA
jgi:hypothetical protein